MFGNKLPPGNMVVQRRSSRNGPQKHLDQKSWLNLQTEYFERRSSASWQVHLGGKEPLGGGPLFGISRSRVQSSYSKIFPFTSNY